MSSLDNSTRAKALSLADIRKKKMEAFIIANSFEDTNFTVRLENYEWLVHGDMLAKESGFFRVIHEGGFKESTTKVVELHEDNPWDFARFIQFIYIRSFEYNDPKHTHSALPLSKVMTLGQSDDEPVAQPDDRSEIEIQSAMLCLASKYDIGKLHESVATALVESGTDVGSHIWQLDQKDVFSFESKAERFLEAFEVIHPYFGDSDHMVKLETRMADFLATAKILSNRKGEQKEVLPILSRDEAYKSQNADVIKNFQEKISIYMDTNPSFTKKYAIAMEKIANKALVTQKWWFPALRSFVPTSFRPLTRDEWERRF